MWRGALRSPACLHGLLSDGAGIVRVRWRCRIGGESSSFAAGAARATKQAPTSRGNPDFLIVLTSYG
jgi:hypothetical protein